MIRGRALRSDLATAIGLAVQSIGAYLLVVVAARVLGPGRYGDLGALLGLLAVTGVLSLGMQATTARRAVSSGATLEVTASQSLRLGWLLGGIAALALLVLAPVITWALSLASILPVVMLALAVAPSTVMGAQWGLLQGRRRWQDFAVAAAVWGASRLLLGVAGLLVRPDATGVMGGVALAAWVPVAVGYLWISPGRAEAGSRDVSLLREVLHDSRSLLGLLALNSCDVLVAKAFLPAHEAGLYAAGAILSRAVLFLPQIVVVRLFPSLATSGDSRIFGRALLATTLLGAPVVVVSGLLPGLALMLVGGDRYGETSGILWVFALLGFVQSVIQLTTYAAVARRHRLIMLGPWVGVVLVVVLGSRIATSPLTLATAMVCLLSVVALTGVAAVLRGSEPRVRQ